MPDQPPPIPPEMPDTQSSPQHNRQFEPNWTGPDQGWGVDGYQDGPQQAWRDGDDLVIAKGANLPMICPFANEIEGVKYKRVNFTWMHPLSVLAVLAGVMFGLLVGLILAMALNKRLTV